jgi:hypothetical protein
VSCVWIRIAFTWLGMLLAACAAQGPRNLAPTLAPTPTPTLQMVIATPAPTPAPTIDPAAGLSFGELSYSADTCFTDVRDKVGHVLHGGIVTFKITAMNAVKRNSAPLWFRIDPTETLLSPPLAMEGSTGKSILLDGQSAAFGGTVVPQQGKAYLHWQVFFETAYAAHYDASMRYSDPSAHAGVSWNGIYTTINVC